MTHVVVLCGGKSAEHEVSFISASSVLTHLSAERYEITVIGIARDGSMLPDEETLAGLKLRDPSRFRFAAATGPWISVLSRLEPPADIVFPVLHGPNGEDGSIQGAMEVLDLPYVGAGVGSSAVAMNKIYSKRLFHDAGLPILPYLAGERSELETSYDAFLSRLENTIPYPLFVKPANMGSSVGVNKARNREELAGALQTALKFDDYVVVEEGIEAREIEVSVLGYLPPRVSTAGEIVPSREFYDYEAKYLDGTSRLLIPARLESSQMQMVQDLALAGYRCLQLEGMARMDFLMDRSTGALWLNEANTIPGFTEISMYPKLWEASGLPYPALLDDLIQQGFERHRRRNRFSPDRHAGSGRS